MLTVLSQQILKPLRKALLLEPLLFMACLLFVHYSDEVNKRKKVVKSNTFNIEMLNYIS